MLPTSLAWLLFQATGQPKLFFYGQLAAGVAYRLWTNPPVDASGYYRFFVQVALHLLALAWCLKHWPTSWWQMVWRTGLFIVLVTIVIPTVVGVLFDVVIYSLSG